MDGIEEMQSVVVIGATNRPNLIDPALLRPGRLDELIYVSVPDVGGRQRILDIHTAKMPLAGDVDLAALAASTRSARIPPAHRQRPARSTRTGTRTAPAAPPPARRYRRRAAATRSGTWPRASARSRRRSPPRVARTCRRAWSGSDAPAAAPCAATAPACPAAPPAARSAAHTAELQSLMRISYAVFCLKKKNIQTNDSTL